MQRIKLSDAQIERISEFFIDLSKLLIASAFVGFFIPGSSGIVNLPTFIIGTTLAIICFVISIKFTPSKL